MSKKTFALLLGSVSLASFAAAQGFGPDTGGALAFIVNSIGPVMERYVGIPITETNALGTFGTIAVFWFGLYLGLEALLDRLGWLDRFTGGTTHRTSGATNRRLVGFSLLLFITLMGSQVFTPLILIVRDSIFLVLTLGALFVVIAGLKAFYFGSKGLSAQAGAKTKKYLADQQEAEAEAEEELNTVPDKAKDIGQKAKQIAGLEDEVEDLLREEDVADAAQEIEVIIKKMKALEDEVESAEQDLSQVLTEVESMMQGDYEVEEDIESSLTNALRMLEAVRQDVENQSMGKHYDYSRFMQSLQEIHDALQEEEGLQPIIVKGAQLERELQEVEQLLQKDLKFMRGDVSDLSNLEAKANDLASQMRDREDFERIQQEIQQSQALERRFSDLLSSLKSLEEETEEARNRLEELQETDQSHGELVRKVRNEVDATLQEMDNNPRAIQGGFGISNDQFRDLNQKMRDIESELQQVEQDIARGHGP